MLTSTPTSKETIKPLSPWAGFWEIPACRWGAMGLLLALMVVVGGYVILPDPSPNANDGNIQLRKQAPNFVADILVVRKNAEIDFPSYIERWWKGTPSKYLLEPYDSLVIDGDFVKILPFGSQKDRWKRYHICDVTTPLYVGPLEEMQFPSARPYIKEHGGYRILMANGKDRFRSMAELHLDLEDHLSSRRYWLGTDRAGRDLLSRLLLGTRISLSIGLLAALLSVAIGVLVGSLAGYYGGWQDQVLSWFMTVVWSIPAIMLIIAISLAFQQKGVMVSFIAVGMTMWVEVARLVRGQVMALKNALYVEAARTIGLSDFKIVFVHILPNIVGELIVMGTANFAAAILLEAGLSFLGLGVQPPAPSWGGMLMEGFNALGTRNSFHLVFFPSLAIMGMVGSINLLGNGLRTLSDPKRKVKG
ncbi:ABC transporter permease [Persicobacter sp. CCB-QB2]|uniref:ABC transporter permease n=1 Tax=Persicobacter sp. CCB-QB2 TaxID=1561025 RepID=UPI000AE7448F|nr:ABC transporter permease [Persicobacter sp. CCB-QB2]